MTYTWKDVGDTPDKKLSQSEKEVIATEWNRYEKEDKPSLDLQSLREIRDMRLAQSDWVVTMHKELGTNIPTAMKTYRQALRDITDDATSLDDVTWPEKP